MNRRGIFGLFSGGVRTLIGCGCFLIILVGIGVFALVSYVQFKQQQAAVLAAYGQNIVDMCKNPSRPSGSSSSASNLTSKVVVLNSDGVTVDRVENALSDDQKAKDKSDVTGVVCVSESSNVFDTINYSGAKYTCTRYQYIDDVYLIDPQSGQSVNYSQFKGPTPPDCPDSATDNINKYGDSPDGTTIKNWIFSIGAPR